MDACASTNCTVDFIEQIVHKTDLMTDDQWHEIDECTRAFIQARIPQKGDKDRTAIMKELAEIAGYSNQRQIENLLNRKRALSTASAEKIAQYFRITHLEMLKEGHRILHGIAESTKPTFTLPTDIICPKVLLVSEVDEKPDIPLEDYYAAALVDGRIAAGPGRGNIGAAEDIRSLVWIYAPALQGRRKHKLTAVQIEEMTGGDSMMPTLYPGDIVLIDHNDPDWDTPTDQAIQNGKIYAVRTGPMDESAGAAIKRLYRTQKGILIASDNYPEHPPEMAWTDDFRELVIGRVVWGWRDLLEV